MSRFDVQHRDAFDSLAAARDAGGARLIVTSPPYPDARTVEQYGGASFDTTLAGYAFSCHRHGRRFVGGDLGHRERDGRRWADIVNDGLRQTTLFDGMRGDDRP